MSRQNIIFISSVLLLLLKDFYNYKSITHYTSKTPAAFIEDEFCEALKQKQKQKQKKGAFYVETNVRHLSY